MRRPSRQTIAYIALLAAAFAVAVTASWTPLGAQIDNDAYDAMFRFYRPTPWQTESALLAIDENSLLAFGGLRNIRRPLAEGLEALAAAHPKAVALDVTLPDQADEKSDARLESALSRITNLVLPCDLLPGGAGWQDPIPRFRRAAKAVGHVHAAPDDSDSVSRAIPLEKATASDRRWALSLEAFRVSRNADILTSPADLEVADTVIPAPFRDQRRLMRVRYMPPYMQPIPRVSLKDVVEHPGLARAFTGRVVFVGATAQDTVRDRLMTPYSGGRMMPGVEIHANAFETIAQRRFLTDAPDWLEVALALLLVIAAGVAYAWLPGWQGYASAALIVIGATLIPYAFFSNGVVFSFATPVSAAWLSVATAAAYQNLVVRRSLRKAEADRQRYQQAMHFVTHEMKTPLTAIQGSSELISRYALPEEKRKQIATMINSESKRLGHMIEMFLNVERLSAGQLQLRKEPFSIGELMAGCVARVRPLAEGKQIQVTLQHVPEDTMTGDRELMEYAFYNLLTNAVKYSPQKTEVTVFGAREGQRVRVSVKDQGIGMDQKEVKQVFQKFYRTRRAEQSGEAGTGIGLSIVEQIVTQHGGAIQVASSPGVGSCFTLVLPAPVLVA